MDDDVVAKQSFLFLAITMVNIQNAATYFLNKPKIDSLQSRRLIAKALINNEYLQSGISPWSGCKHHSVDHVLMTVLHFKKFVKGQLVNCKIKYSKWKCTDCSQNVRSYCSCTPGLMFCTECYGNHRADLAGEEKQATKFSGFYGGSHDLL